jgi:hypothetical protein
VIIVKVEGEDSQGTQVWIIRVARSGDSLCTGEDSQNTQVKEVVVRRSE